MTSEPDKCGERPCIRGVRPRVADIISFLAAGASHKVRQEAHGIE
ncbi:DUF433 domain-containing protein [Massilia solisilvae]